VAAPLRVEPGAIVVDLGVGWSIGCCLNLMRQANGLTLDCRANSHRSVERLWGGAALARVIMAP
jgi:hypothetical protein